MLAARCARPPRVYRYLFTSLRHYFFSGAFMAITITVLPNNTDGSGSNLLYAIGTLTFSGSYVVGGDTLDFTSVADKLPSTQIIQALVDGQNAAQGKYVTIPGTALNNWKLKAFVNAGTELGAVAYS